MNLSIGCGGNQRYCHITKGDVNIDIRKCIEKIENFILCDAEHLPFRNKTFQEATAVHVIEHLKNPYSGIKEALRVSHRVKSEIPCFLSYGAYQDKTHIWFCIANRFYSIGWFERKIIYRIFRVTEFLRNIIPNNDFYPNSRYILNEKIMIYDDMEERFHA